MSANHNKKQDDLPLCKMNKPNQILILERVAQNGNVNTISVVSEDLYKKYESLNISRTSHHNRNSGRSV